jgi:hypothetical protein
MPGTTRNIGQLSGQTVFELKHTSQDGGTELQDLQAPQKSTPGFQTWEYIKQNNATPTAFQPTD